MQQAAHLQLKSVEATAALMLSREATAAFVDMMQPLVV